MPTIEHPRARQRRRRSVSPVPVPRVAYTITEFAEAANISRPTIYKMMKDGQLRFVQLSERFRRIPASEFARLGLTGGSA
jgi:excisionase family DNA binding protein